MELTNSQLKVASDIFANLSAGWLITVITTRDLLTLLLNLIGAILSMYLSIKAEDIRKDYD